MIVNNEIRTKHQIKKENGLHFILSSIWGDPGNYNKKEDDKRK